MSDTERRSSAEALRDRWPWFLALGGVLIVAGGAAILAPALSEATVSTVLGGALLISGIVQVVQAFRLAGWLGFIWQLLLGVLSIVGGALIAFNPLAGVIALTLLIALVFAVMGVTQIGFALRMRDSAGWHWFLIAGVIALATAVLLTLKLSYTQAFTPATIAGVALLFAGWAHVAMALAARKATSG